MWSILNVIHHMLRLSLGPTTIGVRFGDIPNRMRAFVLNGLDFQQVGPIVGFHCGSMNCAVKFKFIFETDYEIQ